MSIERAPRILGTSFVLIFLLLISTVVRATVIECSRSTFNEHFQSITIDTETNSVSIVSFPLSTINAELTYVERYSGIDIYYISATRVDEKGEKNWAYYRISPFINGEISSVSGASFKKIADKHILDIAWDRDMEIECARR